MFLFSSPSCFQVLPTEKETSPPGLEPSVEGNAEARENVGDDVHFDIAYASENPDTTEQFTHKKRDKIHNSICP